MNRLIDENISRKRIIIKPNRPKWRTRELQAKQNRRDNLFKRKPKGVIYNTALREFDELRDTLYNRYIATIENNIISDPAEFWKFAKMNQKTSSYPSEMFYEHDIANNSEQILELFARYYEKSYIADEAAIELNEIF